MTARREPAYRDKGDRRRERRFASRAIRNATRMKTPPIRAAPYAVTTRQRHSVTARLSSPPYVNRLREGRLSIPARNHVSFMLVSRHFREHPPGATRRGAMRCNAAAPYRRRATKHMLLKTPQPVADVLPASARARDTTQQHLRERRCPLSAIRPREKQRDSRRPTSRCCAHSV